MMELTQLSLVCLLVVAAISVNTVNADCKMEDRECDFHFDVEHALTMMHHKDLVYPHEGKLYRYDVTNTSTATPIDVDEVLVADGYEIPRLVAVTNGQFPGPDMIVFEGQTVNVVVKNKLRSHALTIHWHGLHMRATPWMDGVPWVTQCPIHPGQSFKYSFKAKPQGTFWWHTHVGAQRSMGLFGALIVKSRKETVVEDRIIQIMDWNHDYESDTGHMKMLTGVYEGRHKWPGERALDGSFFSNFHVQAGLINGRGRIYDTTTGESNMAPLTLYSVTQGNKYRFRVIGVGSLYPFRVSVDKHVMTVVASDGYELEPRMAESFIINPGERFDFEIEADQPVGNYWIRGLILERDSKFRADAILRYEGAPEQEPMTARRTCTQDEPCTVLNCPFSYFPEPNTNCVTFDELKSLATDDPAPEYEDDMFEEHFLNFAFPGITSYPGSVNGKTFDTPDVNPLVQPSEWFSPCKSPECGEGKHCKCTHALHIGKGKTIQMVFLNMGRGKGYSHPIHMHGHSFYVVKMGYGQYNATSGEIMADNTDIDCRGIYANREESFCNDATWSNQNWLKGNVPGLEMDRPPRKDTIIVPTGGYVVIRIRADNPGLWNMHCHIELHNLDGMQMLINESFADVPEAPGSFPQCHSYPATSYRMYKDLDAANAEKELQERGDDNDEDSGANLTDFQYELIVGLLIAVLVVQVVLGIGMCCVVKKRKPSRGAKYDLNVHGNEQGNGQSNGQSNPNFKS